MGEHSLISVQDPAHKALRALIMPAFTGEALEGQVREVVGAWGGG
jgi:cytochrome P450